jgi:hypothetical protein
LISANSQSSIAQQCPLAARQASTQPLPDKPSQQKNAEKIIFFKKKKTPLPRGTTTGKTGNTEDLTVAFFFEIVK